VGWSTTAMVVLTSVASAVNYGSNLIFSRLLSPESYGDLTALLAIAVVAAVPTAAAQTVLADRIATFVARGDLRHASYFMRHAVAHVALVSLVLGLVCSLSAPLIVPALNLQAIGPIFALIPLIVLCFFMPTAFGILQGLERFMALGGVLLFVALSRIVFGVPWAMAGGGAGGALAGAAIGNMCALLFVAWLIRDHWIPRGTGAATSGIKRLPDRASVSATSAFIAFALLSNLDVVLVKLVLPARESGLYAALVTIEKIIIFLPGAIAVVMVPAAARARVSSGSAARVLRWAAMLVVATTLIAAIPSVLWPEYVLRNMFGAEYLPANEGMLPIVLAGAGLSLLYLLVVYTVAIQDHNWSVLLIGAVAVQITAILLMHDSVAQVATIQAGVIIGALVVNEAIYHPLLKTHRLARRRAYS
jgi:O-antigen/teichoic acid export membrane protein